MKLIKTLEIYIDEKIENKEDCINDFVNELNNNYLICDGSIKIEVK